MSTHALASLTATYTDSEPEGEEDTNRSKKDDDDDKSKSSSDHRTADETEEDKDSLEDRRENPQPSIEVTSRVTTLVSYHDDTVISDDEPDNSEQKINITDDPEDEEPPVDGCADLPPEPTGRVSPRLLERVTKLHERMQQGLDMNDMIQNRKDFRNPSIYEKLIQFCGLNELGTNYPPKMYDPAKWGKDSFYEELARIQKAEMDKRDKTKDKTKVEVVSGTRKPGLLAGVLGATNEDESKRRKSKWDQVGAPGTAAMIRSSGILQPTLTTAVSGTKSTVISAFGHLSKKPKL